MPHKYLIKEFEELARSATAVQPLMQHVSARIHAHIPRYNWIGFYLLDEKDSATLALGPHTGSLTPSAKISVGEGLCGRAASTGEVMVADDAQHDPRCIRASDIVKSQISVPVIVADKTVAIFHVESYFVSAFKAPQERQFVEACAKIIATFLECAVVRDLVNA